MGLQTKGLHSYNYPEVTNILMGQVPYDIFHNASTSANKEYHADTSGTDDSGNVYLPNTDAWCAIKVVSWDSASQLVGAKLQARCIDGFPGDDFAVDGVYAGTTESNNISLVSGDIITGIFDKIAVLGAAASQPSTIIAYRISL